MLRYLTAIFALILALPLFGQDQLKKHYVIDPDSAALIKLEIIDPVEIEYWAGNQIMITSEVKMYGANSRILEHFFNDVKRYEIIDTLLEKELYIHSLQKNREPVKIKERTCYEEIYVKIFMPETFILQEEGIWVIKEEEEKTED